MKTNLASNNPFNNLNDGEQNEGNANGGMPLTSSLSLSPEAPWNYPEKVDTGLMRREVPRIGRVT